MTVNKNTFVVHTEIKEILDELNDNQVALLFRSMVDYSITGEAPEIEGDIKYVWIMIRQQMDRESAKWENVKAKRAEAGRQGGLKSGESRRNNEANEANEAIASDTKQTKQDKANEAVNVNVNENVNVNVNENVNENVNVNVCAASDVNSLTSKLVAHLNKTTGGRYRSTDQLTRRINDLLSEGYTESDMLDVIDKKYAEWADNPSMKAYLRPRTLFGEKFEEYAAAPSAIKDDEQAKLEKLTQLRLRRADEEARLTEALARMEQIRSSPEGIKGSWDEWKELNFSKATSEQSIENIDRMIAKIGG